MEIWRTRSLGSAVQISRPDPTTRRHIGEFLHVLISPSERAPVTYNTHTNPEQERPIKPPNPVMHPPDRPQTLQVLSLVVVQSTQHIYCYRQLTDSHLLLTLAIVSSNFRFSLNKSQGLKSNLMKINIETTPNFQYREYSNNFKYSISYCSCSQFRSNSLDRIHAVALEQRGELQGNFRTIIFRERYSYSLFRRKLCFVSYVFKHFYLHESKQRQTCLGVKGGTALRKCFQSVA